jgi:serine-type D-Ala-D-Ala carboxypeptidase/endopeptidase (penicillin-binding protein 4)
MLDFFNSTMVSAWVSMADVSQGMAASVGEMQNTPALVALSPDGDPEGRAIVQQYLNGLGGKGLSSTVQGVWLQSGPTLLASNQGGTALPAASLTKVATSLAAITTWGPDRRFETLISAVGPIQQGVLNGDLVIQGSGDPLMVWEEAFALGTTLNRLGITKVTGNLVIVGSFQMNFEAEPLKAGVLFKEALNSDAWSEDAQYQYAQLPANTPKPKLAIAGAVQVTTVAPANQTQLVKHYSLSMVQIIKLMNVYSNNIIADALGSTVGGANGVMQKVVQLTGIAPSEISLINASGLGTENRISPRAVAAMYGALQRYLAGQNLTIGDLFPIAGTDVGTIEARNIPASAVVKTGTLNDVSALAGVVPTRDRGLVWFSIINRGSNLDDLRAQQDVLLQQVVNQWGAMQPAPTAIAPRRPPVQQVATIDIDTKIFYDNQRNQIVYQPAVEASDRR